MINGSAPKSATQSSLGTGFLLVTLFIIVFVFVLLLISALQLQRSVQTIKDNDVHATVGSVRLDIATLQNRDIEVGKRTEELANIRSERTAYAARMNAAITKMTAQHRALEKVIHGQSAQFSDISAADVSLPATFDPKLGMLTIDERLATYEEKVREQGKQDKDPRGRVEKFISQIDQATQPFSESYGALQSEWQAAQSADNQADARAAQLTTPLPEFRGNLAKESYRSVVEDFRAYEGILGPLANFVMIPNAMLVLLLSIFMGMLGSLIYLSRKLVLEKEFTSAGELVSRVGLGAAVALALFFFASAGVLAMSQNAAGPDSNDMSPYLISFLGITAGYLSDRVTAWMREVGEHTFKLENGDVPNRWAVGLDNEVKAQDMTSGQLASGTDSSDVDVEDWIALRKSVPGDTQRMISTYLRVDPSKLFTDVKPRNAAA